MRRAVYRAVYYPDQRIAALSQRDQGLQSVRDAQTTDFNSPFLDQLRTRAQFPAPLPVSNKYGIVAAQSVSNYELVSSRAL